jgi:hypothetical protein
MRGHRRDRLCRHRHARGQDHGHPAGGRAVTFCGVQAGRCEDGLLVRRRGSNDKLGMLTLPDVAPQP